MKLLNEIYLATIRFNKRYLPKAVWRFYYSKKAAKLKLPHELNVMLRSYFKTESRYTSKLWLHLMYHHLKRIELELANPESENPFMQHIWKNYTLLFSQSEAQTEAEIKYISDTIAFEQIKYVIELGAGYGRIQEYLTNNYKGKKLIVVDIPPALWVATRYLSAACPELSIEKYNPKLTSTRLAYLLKSSDIIFLMPSQLKLLPKLCDSLVLAINCLQEIPSKAVRYYFKEFSRVAEFMYIKSQIEPHNPYSENLPGFNSLLDIEGWLVLNTKKLEYPDNYSQAIIYNI